MKTVFAFAKVETHNGFCLNNSTRTQSVLCRRRREVEKKGFGLYKIFPHAFDSSLLDDESLPWLFPNMFEWCYSCDSKGFDHFEYRYITVCYQQNQKHLAVISQTFQRNTLAKERKDGEVVSGY